ncbi:hypothetical protein AB0J38_11575 [Streptomyces sp. NPDC050095]|uniref:hypothetical protein n=1 Tax=unclassified Streptomyces TaxID=2593676 RepID=UPI003443071F
MDPHTYATLYGPWKPNPRPQHTGVALLAGAVWCVTAASLAWLTFPVGLTALWGTADGASVGGFVLGYVLALVCGAAVLAAVAFLPFVRRMTGSARMLLLATLACPAPLVMAVVTWFAVG